MTEVQKKEAQERILREAKAIGSIQERLYTIPDVLKIKCQLEDWHQWQDVVASDQATNDNLWSIVQKIVKLRDDVDKDKDKVLDRRVLELAIDISYHKNVSDRLLRVLAENFSFLEWVKMDWSKAKQDTVSILANEIRRFKDCPWLIKQVMPLVEQLCIEM